MNKILWIIHILILSTVGINAQTDLDSLDLRLNSIIAKSEMPGFSDDNFKKETDGVFYVLIPIDEFLAKQSLVVINDLNEEKGFPDLRVSHLWLEDLTAKTGLAHFVLIRRFKEDISANEYLKIIDKNFSLSKGNSVIIAQNNYRLLLEKKKSFEEYIEFFKKDD